MKLTKYTHACLVLEQHDESLVIDPGNFSDDFETPRTVTAVVLTHSHGDHYDEQKLQDILSVNPEVTIYAPKEIADESSVAVVAATPGQKVTIGSFELEFTGGKHATIHPDMKPLGNIGVVVNFDLLYYPGDSFAQPPRHMKWIATPVAAPWMKVSEAIDFLREARPTHAIPTHDAILSPAGHALVDRVIPSLIDEAIEYNRIAIGTSVEL